MRRYQIILILLSFFLVTGCQSKVILDDKKVKTQNEIFEKIKNIVYDKYGNNVTIELESKTNLKVCTINFLDNSCLKYKKVDKAYRYIFKIIDNNTNKLINKIDYTDPYIKNGIYYDEYYSNL